SPLIWLFSGVKLCLKPVPGFAVDQWRAELNRLAVFVDDFRFTSLPAWQLRPVRGVPEKSGVPEHGHQCLWHPLRFRPLLRGPGVVPRSQDATLIQVVGALAQGLAAKHLIDDCRELGSRRRVLIENIPHRTPE